MRTVALIGPELYPIPPIRGGAVELFIDQMAARLTRWRPVVIGPSDPELPNHEVRGGVEYFRVPLSGWRGRLYKRHRRFFPFYDRQVVAILRRVQPDLLHVHNRPLLALALQRKRGLEKIPLILHMHNLHNSLGRRERPTPVTPIPVAGFIGCSQFVVEQEKSRLARDAAAHFVVYNGVDTGSFLTPWDHPAPRQKMRRQYHLIDEPTVLFVGKLRESKGVHILLAAMDQVWPRFPQAVLVLVGGTEFGRGRTDRETPFLRELHRWVETAQGRVVLTGFIPPARIPETYLLGDIFAGPSQIEEGLGLVFLEASAAGLPIIATRRGGIPEIVREDLNGLLLQKHDDPQELAAQIIQLLKDRDLRLRLGQQGRSWVREHFTWEKIAQRQEEVYDEIVGG
ncbi:MAG: glycosyltransferase family 4 protein [Deltaproteobacteria bacterium]|nr:glycosyltransferase family 4 protein [Deltaproteobacteria bacterium]MBI4796380.1 glycosyltransferase family 4 protein [Deltaproteobacteria bacterium]